MSDPQPTQGQPFGFTPTVEGMALVYQEIGRLYHMATEKELLRQKTEARAAEIQEVATRILNQPKDTPPAAEAEPTPITAKQGVG